MAAHLIDGPYDPRRRFRAAPGFNFIGMLPDTMQDSKIYGVELDTISAGIAQQLYQKTTIAAQGFEETNLPDSFFYTFFGHFFPAVI